MAKPNRVTSIPLTSISSGARLIDLMPLPLPLFVAYRMMRWTLKHWYVFTLLILFFVVQDWKPFVLVLLSVPVWWISYVWFNNVHHSPQAILKASQYLWRVRRNWNAICIAGGMVDGPRRPRMVGIIPFPTRTPGSPKYWRPPRIGNEFGTSLIFILDTSGINATARHIEEKREFMTNAVRGKRVRVRRMRPGYVELTIEWESNLTRSAIHSSKDALHSTQLPTVELDEGVDMELDNHLLIVGESGSGKSNLVWHIKSNLNKHGVPHVLYVLDPKQVELADLEHCPQTHRYVDNPRDVNKAIEDFHNMMLETLRDMKTKGIRKVTFSTEYPLHILIIDEMLMIGMVNRQDVADTKFGQILIAGRAAGFIVVANSQLGQVDVLGRVRDLFPQRICMAVKSGHVTASVLGPDAETRGARCSEITEAGTGYIYTDSSGSFQRFRPPLIADWDISMIAKGGVWEPPERRTRRSKGAYVYILWGIGSTPTEFGKGPDNDPTTPDRPLYVGKALNPAKRIKQHCEQPWWNQVDHNLTQISVRFPSEADALEEETREIELKKPLYNQAGRNYGYE